MYNVKKNIKLQIEQPTNQQSTRENKKNNERKKKQERKCKQERGLALQHPYLGINSNKNVYNKCQLCNFFRKKKLHFL